MAEQPPSVHRSKQVHKLFSVMGWIVQGHAVELIIAESEADAEYYALNELAFVESGQHHDGMRPRTRWACGYEGIKQRNKVPPLAPRRSMWLLSRPNGITLRSGRKTRLTRQTIRRIS